MALEVHAHECRNLHEARIDFASSALVAEGDFSDQVMLKPSYRPLNGQLVDFGRVDARIDRPRHQGHAAGLRFITVFRHQRDGSEDGDAGLADGDDVRSCPHHLQELNQVVNEGAEIEAALGEGHIANVMPVGDIDVVVGQHRFDRRAQQCREMTRHRRDH